MADVGYLMHASGSVTNSYGMLGQSGLSEPNQLFSTNRVSVVSSNSGDISTGTGVKKVTVYGYNSGDFVREELSMNGTTAVVSTSSFDLVTDFKITSVGTSGQQGDITLSVSGGSTILKMVKGYGGVHDATKYFDEIHYIDHVDINGDSVDNNTVYEINIMKKLEGENIILYTLYWNTTKNIHDFNLDNLRVNGLIWVRAKNLKHNGPDDVAVSIHFHKLGGEVVK